MASSNQQKTDAEKKLDSEIAKMDLYGLFDVDPEATDKAILKAYRKKALKCHPDKNPDNPKAVEMFHTLSRALEILTDAAARAAYDKIIKAKKAADLRHKVLDSKRKKFKEDLEAREKMVQEGKDRPHIVPDLTQAEKLQKEIDRLRKEGSRMLEEEQERLRQEVQAEKHKGATREEPPRLKLKWEASKTDPNNGGYSHDKLHKMFDKYGQISALIVSKKKAGSAVIEFAQPGAALLAHDNEQGSVENPLKISWLSGKPETSPEASETVLKTPQIHPDILSGFSFSTVAAKDDACRQLPPENDKDTVTCDASAEGDFESLVLRNLRQAQERKRLEQKLRSADNASDS